VVANSSVSTLRGACHVRGSKTHYTPTFTEEQLAEAKRTAQAHHASHAKVIRARLALLLAANPSLHHTAAAKELGVHEQTILKWRRRWCKHGFSLDDDPRSGRPSFFSPR
jgi:transposase-like protein